MSKFCDITSRNDLADFLKIPRKNLTYILYIKKIHSYYSSFDIPKKSGGIRHVNAPAGELKSVQKRLANALWSYQKDIWKIKNIRPNLSHAFEKEKSIITNAKTHKNKRLVLNIDLENFFDSFHFGRVRGFFLKNRNFNLPIEVATVIAQLTCYNGCLPQGAPSSPIITNLICQLLDIRLSKIAKIYKLDYTRYADDLTFSTNGKVFLAQQDEFIRELSITINSAGFNINDKKTRLQYRESQQKVTGLVVNKKLNVDRAYYRNTKAMAYSLYTKGEFEIGGKAGTKAQLEGRFTFINQLDWYNNKLDGKPHNFEHLSGKEKQFKKFLFYKYFFANEMPLVVTEGKTDISYLKSALKNLYENYPNLITKGKSGRFEYKISFLRRTDLKRTNLKRVKRLYYFLKIGPEGADAMKNLFYYFSNESGGGNKIYFPNYFEFFKNIDSTRSYPKNPVVLIFDNELKGGKKADKKPLYNFLSCTKISEEKRALLMQNHCIQLVDDSNLYLVTYPLIDEKEECEIEDLFLKETLEHVIGEKTFSREKDYDVNKHYGKEIFSKYVSKHFESIDFSRFRDTLDNLNKIVGSYKTT